MSCQPSHWYVADADVISPGHYYPQHIQAIGYCRALRRPSRPHYHSTAHNIQWILFIFGTANDLGTSTNPIDYGVSIHVHSLGSSGTFEILWIHWLSSGTFEILWIHWLSWTRPAEGSRPLDVFMPLPLGAGGIMFSGCPSVLSLK